MTDETRSLPPEDTSRDQRLEGVLAEYLRRVDAGEAVDRQAIVVAHPDLAQELREFFANRAHVERIVGKPPAAGVTTADMPPQARFGDYELLDLIARGGMGVVYQARQVSLNRPVAVKMILAGQLASDADVKRFRAEAEAAANLRHPGVVPIYEVGIHDGQHFYSMEYVEGRTLSQVSRDGSLTAAKAAEYVREMAEIVHFAHQQGVLHRDLKPSNVLIDRDDRVRIADFGLAKRVAGESDLTITGQVIGTPSYMPPEQAAAQHALVGAASDVYALGAILYELLTGRVPFRSDNVAETLRQVQQDDPVRPRLLSPRLSKDLETICLKCLEKEPRRRYATAQQLADELGRFLRGEPIQARPIRFWQRGLKWARRRPAVAGLVVALAIVVVVASVTVLRLWQQEREARQQAEANLAAQTIAMARLEWSADHLQQAGQLLERCPARYRDADWKYLWRAVHAPVAVLGDGTGVMRDVVFSANGRAIAVTVSNVPLKPVRAWYLSTKTEIPLPRQSGNVKVLAFLPDERHLVIGGQLIPPPQLVRRSLTPVLRTVNIESGDEVSRITPSGDVPPPHRRFEIDESRTDEAQSAAQLLALSPDGKKLVMESNGVHHHFIADVASGARIIGLESPKALSCKLQAIRFSHDGRWLAAMDIHNRNMLMWDVATGRLIHCISSGSPPGEWLYGVCVSRDRLAFSTGLQNKGNVRVCIINLSSGDIELTIQTPSNTVKGLAFSPDGMTIALGADKTITIWDLAKQREVLTLRGHTAQINSLAFSPDGARLASASVDGTVRIWNVRLDP